MAIVPETKKPFPSSSLKSKQTNKRRFYLRWLFNNRWLGSNDGSKYEFLFVLQWGLPRPWRWIYGSKCNLSLRFCPSQSEWKASRMATEGVSEKACLFILPLKSVYNKKTCVLINKNVFLKTAESFNIKNIYNYTFYLRNVHVYFSRASLYELIL